LQGNPLTRRRLFQTAGAGAAVATALSDTALAPLFAAGAPRRPAIAWQADAVSSAGLPAPDPIVSLVNRITFGLRPDDLARARRLGFDGFVAEQLHPEAIDDSESEAAVAAAFPTLGLAADALLAHDKTQVVLDLKGAMLLRAVRSRRQLFELMVDFWTNHFNIYQLDGNCAFFKTVDDREVVRKYAFGKFHDLLRASAKSPAMLVYLNNAVNTRSGPNENYGREVMELHTLGVDGGYTQADVQAVARCFTGWTVGSGHGRQGGRRGEFLYRADTHDDGAHTVLGNPLPAGLGSGHGERVIDLLAAHPSTARFVSTKLIRRFVSDAPPASLVDAAVRTFTATGGDLREVMRTLLTSAEFRAAADQKLRRPLEGVAAALRTLDAQVMPQAVRPLIGVLRLQGQVPFDWHPPNGYPDANGAWSNTNGLLNRWNLGLSLANNTLAGVHFDLDGLLASVPGAPRPTAAALVDAFADRLLARDLAPADRDQLAGFVAEGTAGIAGAAAGARLDDRQARQKAPSLVALLLDSPYFQWR
jgi:uncharacterized protein (DUF1800 family)